MTVQAVIKLEDETNRAINIVKAMHGFKDKSEAINFMLEDVQRDILEPQVRPEYLKKLDKIKKEKHYTREEFEKIVG